MRITRDTLLKFTRERVSEMVKRDRQIICVYLTGSMLTSNPFLGGSTDVDLIVIHPSQPEIEREFLPVTDEIHLDIQHYYQEAFHQPRHLRIDPWLGYPLCQGPLCLHDVQHWFEFTQASVFAQFNRPENILQRAQPLAEKARSAWMELHTHQLHQEPESLLAFFNALEYAAQAVALLGGPPLTERRFLLEFPRRTQEMGRPGLASGWVDILSANPLPDSGWKSCMQAWEDAFNLVQHHEPCPPALNICRKPYLFKAAEAFRSEHPVAAQWIMLRSWNQAVNILSPKSPARKTWHECLPLLGFDAPQLSQLVQTLDNYLDMVEETMEWWGQQNGVISS